MLSYERHFLNLLHTYAERIDAGDTEGVAELFEHAVVTAQGDREFRGRDEVRQMFTPAASTTAPAPPSERQRRPTKHVTTNVILEMNDEETHAKTRSVYVVVTEDDGGNACIMTAGRYHDEFELVDGRWRFAARRYLQDVSPVTV